eukprot:844071-Pyramimonas_sp.AAC.1
MMTTNQNARLNIRHIHLVGAWRKVFTEAGGLMPDRNVERSLRDTYTSPPRGPKALGLYSTRSPRGARITIAPHQRQWSPEARGQQPRRTSSGNSRTQQQQDARRCHNQGPGVATVPVGRDLRQMGKAINCPCAGSRSRAAPRATWCRA